MFHRRQSWGLIPTFWNGDRWKGASNTIIAYNVQGYQVGITFQKWRLFRNRKVCIL